MSLNSHPLNTYPINDERAYVPVEAEDSFSFVTVAVCGLGQSDFEYLPETTVAVGKFIDNPFNILVEAEALGAEPLKDSALNSYAVGTYPVNHLYITTPFDGESILTFNPSGSHTLLGTTLVTFETEGYPLKVLEDSLTFNTEATGTAVTVLHDTALNNYPLNSYPLNAIPVTIPGQGLNELTFEVFTDYASIGRNILEFDIQAAEETSGVLVFEGEAVAVSKDRVTDTALNSYPLNKYPVNSIPELGRLRGTNLLNFEVEAFVEVASTFEYIPHAKVDIAGLLDFESVATGTAVPVLKDTALNSYPLNKLPVNSQPEPIWERLGTFEFIQKATYQPKGTSQLDYLTESEHLIDGHTVFTYEFEAEYTPLLFPNDTALNSQTLGTVRLAGSPAPSTYSVSNDFTFSQEAVAYIGENTLTFEQVPTVAGQSFGGVTLDFKPVGNISPDGVVGFGFTTEHTFLVVVDDTSLDSFRLADAVVNGEPVESLAVYRAESLFEFDTAITKSVVVLGNESFEFTTEYTHRGDNLQAEFEFDGTAEVDSPIQRGVSSLTFEQATTVSVGRLIDASFEYIVEITGILDKTIGSSFTFEVQAYGPPDGGNLLTYEQAITYSRSHTAPKGLFTFEQEVSTTSSKAISEIEGLTFTPVATVYHAVDPTKGYDRIGRANNLYGVLNGF